MKIELGKRMRKLLILEDASRIKDDFHIWISDMKIMQNSLIKTALPHSTPLDACSQEHPISRVAISLLFLWPSPEPSKYCQFLVLGPSLAMAIKPRPSSFLPPLTKFLSYLQTSAHPMLSPWCDHNLASQKAAAR
jgi:hypothetical protein